ncbi:hypothetical protein N0V93_008892 [Gnomoniopsis smithogilvyi]|uniref:Cytochrome P450 n=1 Tax=Gnomoniopsis smithogilvyi TaxID=1191159 RepID=A0A9W8YJF1_9PEZI|nr:hypothetical protein N0V93_008892 [Gnomoniopsis smithogilvyi]
MAPLATRDHARQRGAVSWCFTNSALLQQQKLMKIHIDKLVNQLKIMASKGQPADMSNWCKSTYLVKPRLRRWNYIEKRSWNSRVSDTYTTFDLMGDLTFGKPFGCLDQGSASDWSMAIINVFISGAWEQAIRRIAGVDTWLQKKLTKLLVPKEAAKWRLLHFSKSKETTLARLKDGAMRDHPDVIHQILKNKESRNNLTDTEILLNMVLFISAGSETTAGTLAAWTYFCSTHPEIWQRLVQEVRECGLFKSEDDIIWENLGPEKLPFLDATINEALRLFSPAAASQQRIVPPGGATIDGHYIPEGVCVATPPYGCTRLASNFKDPNDFHPERWMSDPNYADDKLDASQPFSVGPRACIAKNLAYFELRLILTRVIWNFDMELDQGQLGMESKKLWGMDMKHIKGYLTWIKPPLWVNFKMVDH